MSLIGNICLFKLLNGEEIIGKFDNQTEHNIQLSNPLLVDSTVNEEGMDQVVLVSYVPFGKGPEQYNFNKFHVIQILPLIEEAQRYYLNSLRYNQEFLDIHKESQFKRINDSMEKSMEAIILSNNQAKVSSIDLEDIQCSTTVH